MFKKCLKYDLRAFYKVWLIAASVMLVISLLGGVGTYLFSSAIMRMDSMENVDEASFAYVFTILSMFVGMLSYIAVIYATAIFAGGTNILLYVRYYTHFFSDQGYLTFTLPVKREMHFYSKTVSGLVYMLASSVVAAFAVLCMIGGFLGGFLIPALRNPEMAADFNFDLSAFTGEGGVANVLYVAVLAVLFFILVVAVEFASLMTQYLIITLAATLFRNHKLISVIVAYLGFGALSMVAYFVGYFFIMIYVMFLAMFLVWGFMALFTVPILGWLGIYALVLVAACAFGTVGLVFANCSMQRLERKLNLA